MDVYLDLKIASNPDLNEILIVILHTSHVFLCLPFCIHVEYSRFGLLGQQQLLSNIFYCHLSGFLCNVIIVIYLFIDNVYKMSPFQNSKSLSCWTDNVIKSPNWKSCLKHTIWHQTSKNSLLSISTIAQCFSCFITDEQWMSHQYILSVMISLCGTFMSTQLFHCESLSQWLLPASLKTNPL